MPPVTGKGETVPAIMGAQQAAWTRLSRLRVKSWRSLATSSLPQFIIYFTLKKEGRSPGEEPNLQVGQC